ncbi:MAG: glycosyltransferase family 9 protein [Nitrospira defluvii]|nr:glycosyltransferase family 9 protein [Nitrospira defluvii]
MLPESASNSRALLIQLARLGDLVQSLPAIEAVQERYPERPLDLLSSAPLAPVLARSQSIHRLIPWDGTQWRTWADQWAQDPAGTLRTVQTYLTSLGEIGYDRVYNLNQHARGTLMTHLFSRHAVETAQEGQSNHNVSPWAQYLRQVAKARGENRVHLADAWCGMCGVRPRGHAPVLAGQEVELPEDLSAIGERKGLWIALATGAGDSARCVSPAVWASWIREFLTQVDEGQVVLIGSGQEREAGQAILEATPTLLQGRVWDTTGRTTVTQLMTLLGRCRWVIGADTGPLHLATAVGSRALGFYFARARVHETGPYGEGHWVYQHATQTQPDSWPITESIELICDGRRRAAPGWPLWKSHLDRWGVFFDDGSAPQAIDLQRAAVWHSLSPTLYESVAA